MPTPTEKALKQVLLELRANRKAIDELSSGVKGLQVALGEFHHDHEGFKDRFEKQVASVDERVKRVEKQLKLRPA